MSVLRSVNWITRYGGIFRMKDRILLTNECNKSELNKPLSTCKKLHLPSIVKWFIVFGLVESLCPQMLQKVCFK